MTRSCQNRKRQSAIIDFISLILTYNIKYLTFEQQFQNDKNLPAAFLQARREYLLNQAKTLQARATKYKEKVSHFIH